MVRTFIIGLCLCGCASVHAQSSRLDDLERYAEDTVPAVVALEMAVEAGGFPAKPLARVAGSLGLAVEGGRVLEALAADDHRAAVEHSAKAVIDFIGTRFGPLGGVAASAIKDAADLLGEELRGTRLSEWAARQLGPPEGDRSTSPVSLAAQRVLATSLTMPDGQIASDPYAIAAIGAERGIGQFAVTSWSELPRWLYEHDRAAGTTDAVASEMVGTFATNYFGDPTFLILRRDGRYVYDFDEGRKKLEGTWRVEFGRLLFTPGLVVLRYREEEIDNVSYEGGSIVFRWTSSWSGDDEIVIFTRQ